MCNCRKKRTTWTYGHAKKVTGKSVKKTDAETKGGDK